MAVLCFHRMDRAGAVVLPGLMLLLVVVLTGCSTPGSTRISVEDYEEMSAKMAASLRRSDAFAERDKDSEPWIVSIDKVLNLSTEIMPRSEQWGIIEAVRGGQPIEKLWTDKKVVFVIPAEHAIDSRATLDAERADKGFGSERKVTHVITATFRSTQPRTTENGDARSDLYRCTFKMIDLKTNQPVWTDEFSFKRTAKGSIRD